MVDPAGFPCFASVCGEGLFGLRVVGIDRPDPEANENGASVVRLLVDELAAEGAAGLKESSAENAGKLKKLTEAALERALRLDPDLAKIRRW